MLVWPPIPLQPDDEGPDRKFAHSDRFALPMIERPGRPEPLDDEGVVGRGAGEGPRPGRRGHPGRVDVVLDDDRDAEQRPAITARRARRPRGRRRGPWG